MPIMAATAAAVRVRSAAVAAASVAAAASRRQRRSGRNTTAVPPWWLLQRPQHCVRRVHARAGPKDDGVAKSTAAAAVSSPPQPAAAAQQDERAWQAGPGGWAVACAAAPVLLIDGTSVAARCRRGPPGDARAPAERFAQWLAFLKAAVRPPPRLAIVAFDNKGSAAASARGAAFPGYNRARHRGSGGSSGSSGSSSGSGSASGSAADRRDAPMAGWSHLDSVARAAGALPVHAAAGYEADDALAALAARALRQHQRRPQREQIEPAGSSPPSSAEAPDGVVSPQPLPPPPPVIVVSGDSDMEQLLAPGAVYW